MKFFLFLRPISIVLLMCNVLIMSSVQAQTAGNKSLPSVTDGDYVYIEYTLKLEDGEVVDSNVGSDPMNFIHGKGQIVPGLEKQKMGTVRFGKMQSGRCREKKYLKNLTRQGQKSRDAQQQEESSP